MPTTLSSGVALTQVSLPTKLFTNLMMSFEVFNHMIIMWYLMQLVGGNTALALAMTVLSNLLGILIVSNVSLSQIYHGIL